ncbi:hypothetical protein CTEN210_09730 [Chaetoceros tenuissimus]|uniref:ABM domain-containing protein n=1 Tax=Chaetoceros tenuissimus TaxID=426638 RepID=A0AAD3H7Y1_9STRA|nr:hypothetical protein CTEN210_09730 [Chaetoceros tenuissimus]
MSMSSSSTSTPTSTNNKKPYAVNLKFSVKPSRREDFLSLIKDNQRKTLELEPASLQYTVGEDLSKPNTFYIHEQFIGAEGFDAHRAMDHAGDWAAFKSSDPFEEGGEPVLDFYYGDHEIEDLPNTRPVICYGMHVELCIKPDVREEFLEYVKNIRETKKCNPLCLQYVYGESTSEEYKFVFHEEYTLESNIDDIINGYEICNNAQHFEEAWEDFAAKDPFTKPPVYNLFWNI